MKIQIAGLVNDSIVDGKGLRFGIYTQGCPHLCKDCHNPKTHDFQGGKIMDTEDIKKEILENPLLDGITFSGGEPMEQPLPLLELAKFAKEQGLNLWAYTGYTFEELMAKDDDRKKLLGFLDILVDGPFIIEERSLELAFRGSKNQRIINVQKSLAENTLVLMEW